MTAFLYRPHVRRTITALFWVTAGGLGAAIFIAFIWLVGIAAGRIC